MNVDLADAMLSGVSIGPGQAAHCDRCNVTLRPNDRAEVLVLFDGADVSIVTTRCLECARWEIAPETARTCWLAHGELAPGRDQRGRSRVVLTRAVVIDRNE